MGIKTKMGMNNQMKIVMAIKKQKHIHHYQHQSIISIIICKIAIIIIAIRLIILISFAPCLQRSFRNQSLKLHGPATAGKLNPISSLLQVFHNCSTQLQYLFSNLLNFPEIIRGPRFFSLWFEPNLIVLQTPV